MTQRTINEQNIEQVALLIAEGYLTLEEAKAINSGDGWGFDICYDQQQPYSEGLFTRVRECVLSEKDLLAAYQMAQDWDRKQS